VNLDEEDEWAAIQKFNALLHYEEQKQTAAREAERKRLLRKELDAQVEAKQVKKCKGKEEDAAYNVVLTEHLKVLDSKEEDKKKQMAAKIQQEKDMRDAQLHKLEQSRKKEQRENLTSEKAMIKRFQQEIEHEKQVALDKKKQERDYYDRIMQENEKNKALAKLQKEKQRLEDIKAQEAYSRMLD